jgi:mRNA-degrading endonuclease RelE of RelBE toxin-antitoxin system
MPMKVLLSREAQRDIAALPVAIRARVHKLLQRLARWPEVSGVKPLSGALGGSYRIRTGDYRLLFRIERDRLLVVRIGHRDRFYEE